ncbi:MAG: helix-turn-helix domain-containing protein [Clostridiaceae bacterium]|jgi:excisionase family DNA binding protein|nr:helix-turn-helix domain-containing protein [Clostridiaceae bacterium]
MRRKGGKTALAGQPVRLLTVKETAVFLGVTPKTVRRWLNDKDHPLPGVKINSRAWRVVEGDLLEFQSTGYIEK